MRFVLACLALMCVLAPVLAQDKKVRRAGQRKGAKDLQGSPSRLCTNAAPIWLSMSFKKADKQDDGHCRACQDKMMKYGIELGEWKTAELGAEEWLAEAHGDRDVALAHYDFARVLMAEGLQKHKDEFFTRAHDELTKALAAVANFPDAVFTDGRALAHLRQDDAAKARFAEFVKMKSGDDPGRQRALRYINRPELARARMAPPFR